MHGYAYLDKDDNGKFDVDYTNSGVTNARDLVSYSYYKDKNSAGSRASMTAVLVFLRSRLTTT